ncbi:ABC transporter ATP-binding protein [Streptacidiphilus cavernicola]|uniref:ABC transporter ATP-binding protein n=1 Tax=Streptacidiphilus cavernicola TaxID=3342716 RepID=A0ABV6VZE6_9ACTN
MDTTPLRTDAVTLHGVSKHYGQVHAVRGLDLEIPRGRTVALLGPNGAGKSTTVGMLLGLLAPDAGTVAVGGLPPRTAVARGLIAAMLQDCGPMPGVTVAELVTLGRRLYPRPLAVGEALELAGLTAVARRRVDRLSGGQVQRLKFALVAVGNPDTMVLDEPTRALDVQGRREFWTAMRGYAATGRTIVFATHYLDEVEENADRVVVMARGTVVADGTATQIRALAGRATVRFRLSDPPARPPRGWLGAGSVDIRGDLVTLGTADPDATVRALAAGPLAWRDLSVVPPSLDESFLQLTAPAAAAAAAAPALEAAR